MATQKPPKKNPGSPEPENPRAEPGCFIVRGLAWFDEYGEMVIDEDGKIPGDIELDLFEYGDHFFDERVLRMDGSPRANAVPVYELRLCPVPKMPTIQKAKAKSRKW